MKTVPCAMCGKEISEYSAFQRQGQSLCEDCAAKSDQQKQQKQCAKCGSTIEYKKDISLNGKHYCCDCAFDNGKADYEAFTEALHQANRQRETARRKQNATIIIGTLVSGIILSAIIGALLVVFADGRFVLLQSVSSFILLYSLIKHYHNEDFSAYSVESFYKTRYPNAPLFRTENTDAPSSAPFSAAAPERQTNESTQ